MSERDLIPLAPVDVGKVGFPFKFYLQQHFEKNKKNRYFSIEAGGMVLTRNGLWTPIEDTKAENCVFKTKIAALNAFRAWLEEQLHAARIDRISGKR